jgi:hypothetical protein
MVQVLLVMEMRQALGKAAGMSAGMSADTNFDCTQLAGTSDVENGIGTPPMRGTGGSATSTRHFMCHWMNWKSAHLLGHAPSLAHGRRSLQCFRPLQHEWDGCSTTEQQ